MSNMGYCRFRNTYPDLVDCYEHIDDELTSEEQAARKYLIELCKKIVYEIEEEEIDETS